MSYTSCLSHVVEWNQSVSKHCARLSFSSIWLLHFKVFDTDETYIISIRGLMNWIDVIWNLCNKYIFRPLWLHPTNDRFLNCENILKNRLFFNLKSSIPVSLFSPQPQWTIPTHSWRESHVWGILLQSLPQRFTKTGSSSHSDWQVITSNLPQVLPPPKEQPAPSEPAPGPKLQQTCLYSHLPTHAALLQACICEASLT